MKILNSKPRQDNSVILFQKGFSQQTDKNQSFIELVLGAESRIMADFVSSFEKWGC